MSEQFPLPDIKIQADLIEQKGIGDLLRCPNAWALRHRFINQDTGEWRRVQCNYEKFSSLDAYSLYYTKNYDAGVREHGTTA